MKKRNSVVALALSLQLMKAECLDEEEVAEHSGSVEGVDAGDVLAGHLRPPMSGGDCAGFVGPLQLF